MHISKSFIPILKNNPSEAKIKSHQLIDDYKKNIIEWEAKGGIGVHHISVSKTIGELKRLGFK